MKPFFLAVLLAVWAPTTFADRVGVYDNAKVYLYETPCKEADSEGLKAGRVVYAAGREVGLCWVEQDGAVWIIDDDGQLAAEDAARYKAVK